jgi:MFS family permease
MGFAYGINDVLFNLYLFEAGFTEDFIGFFLSISMFIIGGLAIGLGMLADRFPRKKMLLIGISTTAIAIFIQYSTLNPQFLMLSQLLNGLGAALTGVCWQPYTVSITTEEERVHVFSIRFAFFLVANLMGSLVGGFLPSIWSYLGFAMNLLIAYRLSLWIGLIPMVFAVIIMIPLTTDSVPKVRSKIGFSNIRNRGFIGKYAFAWTVSGVGAGLIVHLFNLFFTNAFGVDEATIGIIFAIYTIIVAAGNFASPAIVDRLGKFGTIIWFQILSIPFLGLLSWSPILAIGVIGFWGRGLAINIAWPVMDVFYMEGLEKEEQSTAMGVINTGDALSRAIGINIAGIMMASGFLRAPYTVAIFFYVASIILFYRFFGNNERNHNKSVEVENNGT